jgi:hypothetical protein
VGRCLFEKNLYIPLQHAVQAAICCCSALVVGAHQQLARIYQPVDSLRHSHDEEDKARRTMREVFSQVIAGMPSPNNTLGVCAQCIAPIV